MRKLFRRAIDEDTHMADPLPYPHSNGNTGDRPDSGSTTSTPRWVKVFGIIALVLILLFVILHLAGVGLGGHRQPIVHEVQQP
jgi:hypothetical protein